MINLFLNFYIDKHPNRQQELVFCLRDNVNNKLIDNIYVLADPEVLPTLGGIINLGKFKFINFVERPTYSDFIKEINKVTKITDINIISNTDIFFDETLELLNNIKEGECYALSRWNIEGNGGIALFNRRDSQDVWIFRGHVKTEINGFFTLGKPGCDNRIAHEIQTVGYRIYNPSLSIRTIHFHNTEVRNFDWNDESQKVPPPYLLLDPAYL